MPEFVSTEFIYIVREPFPGSSYKRGDRIADPSVLPKRYLDQHCIKAASPYKTVSPADTPGCPIGGKPVPEAEK
jgi:hypothetical protein